MAKKITIIALLIFIANTSYSQIGVTKSVLTQLHKNYTMEKTDDGTDYIYFPVEFKNHTQDVYCYLTDKKDNEEQLCNRVVFLEPASEANTWIKYFNKRNFVKLEGMTWKDYEHSIVYDVTVEEGSCLVLKYYDEEL